MTYAKSQASLGNNLRHLLANSQSWVNRRVDSLRLEADGTTRRFVSLDITIPKQWMCIGTSGRILVPLGVLEKGTKQRFDASHEGKSIPVLGRRDNAAVVSQILYASQPDLIARGSTKEVRDDLFDQIASCNPEASQEVWEKYLDWSEAILDGRELTPEQQAELETFDILVQRMTENFVLLVEIDKQFLGRRTVMKYALDQDDPLTRDSGTSQLVIGQPVPDLGFAASHHMELEVPTGLIVSELQLVELKGESDERLDRFARRKSTGKIAHVNLEPSTQDAVGFLRADLTVATQGVYAFTKVTLVAVLAVVIAAFVVRHFNGQILRNDPEIPSPAASILLIGPALLISWVSRTREHPVVARMLKPLRYMLAIAAFSLVLMAALAAVKVQPWIWETAWLTIAILSVANLIWMAVFALNLQLPTRAKFDLGVEEA